MKSLQGSLFFIISILFIGCTGSKKASSTLPMVNFTSAKSMSDILEKAEKDEKLVFIDVVTEWCLPCKMMEKDVFTDPEIAAFMNQNFINYKVDAEKGNGPMVSLVYEVQMYPTLLFVDSKGEVIVKKIGAAYHTELMELAKSALASNDLP